MLPKNVVKIGFRKKIKKVASHAGGKGSTIVRDSNLLYTMISPKLSAFLPEPKH